MVIVCDDPDREDEGDLCMAAEFVTAKAITFMACQARGLICLSLPEERCEELDLPLMVPSNNGCEATGFCVSIEAREGVTTGISAADRARTIQVAMGSSTAWAGTMAYAETPCAGRLYRLELDGSCTLVLDGLTISNGMGWSPDGTTMYLADSGTGDVHNEYLNGQLAA